jgi:hypothetical protein
MVVHDELRSAPAHKRREAQRLFIDRPSASLLVAVLKKPYSRIEGISRCPGEIAGSVPSIQDKADSDDIISAGYSTAP